MRAQPQLTKYYMVIKPVAVLGGVITKGETIFFFTKNPMKSCKKMVSGEGTALDTP